MKWLANLLDRFLDWIAPLPDFTGPDWLTDEEAERDSWLSDELLASHLSADATIPGVGGSPTGSPDPLVAPSGTDSASQRSGAAGFTTDEQRIQELVADYENFLRQLFRS